MPRPLGDDLANEVIYQPLDSEIERGSGLYESTDIFLVRDLLVTRHLIQSQLH